MLARLLLSLLLLLFSFPVLHAAQKPDDREALAGLKTARVIVDIRVADPDKLVFNLQLLRETYEGMVAQGVKPRMVIAFRGPGIGMLVADELDEEALDLIRTLKKKGVRFEACAYAMRVAKADPANLVAEVKLVANVLNSVIGYQNKGYALVLLN